MAVWRKKAYDLFGFQAGDYSFSHGKIDLFADIIFMAKRAGRFEDDELLDRIASYVTWASAQKADGVQSSVDLAFFLPMFRDPEILDLFRSRLPTDLLEDKARMLVDDSDVSNS